MRKLIKPTEKAIDIFKLCISTYTDAALKARLASAEKEIENQSSEFEKKIVAAELYKIATQEMVGSATAKELENVYTFKMSRKNTPGRPLYDKLMSLPKFGRCPLCGQRIVSTLDHHLPKSLYPALSVTPVNLIPSCKDCNYAKLTSKPTSADQETIHPYFDDIENGLWLGAEVIELKPASLRFYVQKPDGWNDLLFSRVQHHFKTFGLSALYASHSAEELINISSQLEDLHQAGGKDEVRKYLLECLKGRKSVYVNSWQTATYRAIANNDWYCDGGFK